MIAIALSFAQTTWFASLLCSLSLLTSRWATDGTFAAMRCAVHHTAMESLHACRMVVYAASIIRASVEAVKTSKPSSDYSDKDRVEQSAGLLVVIELNQNECAADMVA